MIKYDVIIIGAGISGLAALKELVENGYRCCLLEASPRAGGRIHTFLEDGFEEPVEGGAEFIHGNLLRTLKLLKKADLSYDPVDGKMIAIQKGVWSRNEEHDDHWPQFMKELNKLKSDITVGDFLDQYFAGEEYKGLRKAVRNFAEGFDLADISRVSSFSLKKEWNHENDQQFRIKGGYGRLVDWLLDTCRPMTNEIHFSSPVERIEYKRNNVIVHTIGGLHFDALKVVVTASPGALVQSNIKFDPQIAGLDEALKQSGFGSVIKFLFQFKSAFWCAKEKDLGFLLSDEVIPTWWTQYPRASNLLTGWLGGPSAREFSGRPEFELMEMGIQSLSSIFHLEKCILRKELQHYKIICWKNQPFIHGGYSYETLYSAQPKAFFSRSFEDALYFAGEAFSKDAPPGTVEAALESAEATVRKIRENSVPA